LNDGTVSGNSVNNSGGGIHNSFNSATLTLNNSTISSNTVSIANGTGGGIANSAGTVTLKNTIIAGNSVELSGPDCSGTMTSLDYNLIGDPSGCTITGSTTNNKSGDPKLGPLADNGGPTKTHALLTNSPAIDEGNPATPGSGGNACLATDQRGTTRPQGPNCDIGARACPCVAKR
jgi:hypothetical protein